MGRPVWLLDVDGVINVTRPGWKSAPRSGTAYSDGVAYRMRWASALTDRIRALQRAGSVEIHWCSTWCSDAEQVERLFALPCLNRAWTDHLTGTAAAAAKLAAARRVLKRGRRLIWTDDTEVPTDGPVHEELTATGRTLLIAPLPNRGLQPDHMDSIEAFISASPGEGLTPPAEVTSADDALLIARRHLGGGAAPTQ